ncbi:class I SAM-dependent methyltransferase [Pseudonocardia endophytica]|uniref:Methyltransferase family protein n=1 Tax=Pseudonocardia endophytica TaxID=401976 RepID=A0A4R1HU67_PSEEN|nr:methyltransferase domain-containing protein [Pseudonocardia endophytica]TCK26234.1 methyltransferase family protein [Pseudonocardia endophytica]
MGGHDERVERGRRYWDNLSSFAPALERTASALDTVGLDRLGLGAGQSVLDVGCGAGAAFPALCDAVGPDGRVVGVDLSGAMLDRARERVAEHRLWQVELVHAEISGAELEPGGFDGAVAVFALSAVADVDGALRTVRRALRPGCRLLVVDLDLVPRGPAAPLTWATRQLYRRRAGAATDDLAAAARAVFDAVEILDLPLGAGSRWAPLVGLVATA